VRRAGSAAPVETANGEYVSGNFFKTFGISAWRGRLFTDADDQEGTPPVAVISFHAWQGKYGSDPSVVGATFEINGHPFTMIGVAPPSFFGAKVADSDMPDFWLPLTTEPLIAGATSDFKNPRLAWLDLIGRVIPARIRKSGGAAPGRLPMAGEPCAGYDLAEKNAWEKQTVHLTPAAGAFP